MKKLCTIVLLIAFQSCFSSDQMIGPWIGLVYIGPGWEKIIRQQCSGLGITYDLCQGNSLKWVAYHNEVKYFPLSFLDAYFYLLELKVKVLKEKSACQRAQQEQKEQEIKRR